MENEQLLQRLEWLEEERRKDKTAIAMLQERLNALEALQPNLAQQIKDLSAENARLSSAMGRFEQIDATIAQLRIEFTRSLETTERQRNDRDREAEKTRLADLEMLNKAIGEVRKGLEPISELRRGLQARVEEDFRLARLIEETSQKVLQTRRSDDEYRHAQKLLEENQRQDNKRITDLTGEVAALRKRIEEQRGKVDLVSDAQRRIETRISDFQAADTERRQAIASFIEKQTMGIVERERTWKEWQTRFEEIERTSTNIDAQLQALDATQRAVKRAQEAFEEITQRFERRINEITEMQRLVEERFRQEWVAFKADDQKRWANYSLTQEEQQREVTRQFEKLTERLLPIEDMLQQLKERLTQLTEDTSKRLQSLLTLNRQWVENFEQTFRRS